ncbi:RsmD family RNA methyltransferase, partial [Pseudoalteromonas tunicata]
MKPNTSKSNKSTSGQIRIISGQYRGRKLPVKDVQGLRPTTDRVKETVFNWLMNDVRDTVVLDCFAGSGGLGLKRY